MSEGSFTDEGIEWQPEYRDDDVMDEGYCPICGELLRDVSVSGKGYCEKHQWVFAEWTQRKEPE